MKAAFARRIEGKNKIECGVLSPEVKPECLHVADTLVRIKTTEID